MSHANIYVLKRIDQEDPYDEFKTTEEELFRDFKHIDYADELTPENLVDFYRNDVIPFLKKACGKENIEEKEIGFIIKRAGIEKYFRNMRDTLFNMIQNDMDVPINVWIGYNIHSWYAIREYIETEYDTLWKFESHCPLPIVSFFQTLYSLNEDEYHLELIQAFDYHM